ncbi:hypothetical protein MMC07_000452 [Pseudocyphellaria aurata]|nr:hypothetical protein [Pseudocyphellaria aurata]
MSDSSLSSVTPSQVALEQALRKAVQRVYKLGNPEELTIKRIRAAAEHDLDLEEDFFKTDSTWKEKSKNIIQSEFELHTDVKSVGDPSLSQSSPKPKATKKLPKAQEPRKSRGKGAKRASPSEVGSKKRRKVASDEEASAGDDVGAKPAPVAKAGKHASPSGSPALNTERKEESEAADRVPEESKPIQTAAANSDSEMSVVIDEKPKSKSKGRNPRSAKAATKKSGGSKASKGTDKSADPDAEEIKRLQGWLVKCGCRKMWYKELAPYDTPKLKIRHLKEMLSDIGMTGRFSIEKATQIRDERELKADLEAVQEGDKQWGKDESEKEGTSKPRKRLARGLKELDFLNDDDGAETD